MPWFPHEYPGRPGRGGGDDGPGWIEAGVLLVAAAAIFGGAAYCGGPSTELMLAGGVGDGMEPSPLDRDMVVINSAVEALGALPLR